MSIKCFFAVILVATLSSGVAQASDLTAEQKLEIDRKSEEFRQQLTRELVAVRVPASAKPERDWNFDRVNHPRVVGFEISSLASLNPAPILANAPSFSLYHGYVFPNGFEVGLVATLQNFRGFVSKEETDYEAYSSSWLYGAGMAIAQHVALSGSLTWSPSVRARWMAYSGEEESKTASDRSEASLSGHFFVADVLPVGFTLKSESLEIGFYYGMALGIGRIYQKTVDSDDGSVKINQDSKLFSLTGALSARYRY